MHHPLTHHTSSTGEHCRVILRRTTALLKYQIMEVIMKEVDHCKKSTATKIFCFRNALEKKGHHEIRGAAKSFHFVVTI